MCRVAVLRPLPDDVSVSATRTLELGAHRRGKKVSVSVPQHSVLCREIFHVAVLIISFVVTSLMVTPLQSTQYPTPPHTPSPTSTPLW